jgi:hypothetical protein
MHVDPSRSVTGTAALPWAAATLATLVFSAAAAVAALAGVVPAALLEPLPHAAQAAPISDAELEQARIQLTRTMCYGPCPDYEVTISGSGEVSYNGKQFVKVKGTQHATIDREKVRQLLTAFDHAKFFALRGGKCPCAVYTDMPSAIITLTWRGRTRTLEHDYGCPCAPAALSGLEHQIDQAADTDRWVGDREGPVASSGPYPPR